MYTQYFQLKQPPFSIAPDPRYLFMSERHREALAHLLYGVGGGGGFVLLTGEIGAGKTTVCRCFIEQIPAETQLAYIFNPKLTVEELLQAICDEFGIAAPAGASVKGYVDRINAHLLASHAAGRNNVLVIDEAQNLSADVLEQLRLLTNLETSERKLLQIILIGQPELRDMLARPELEQLGQRVIARYHLGSLSEEETGSYIQHRLAVAGLTGPSPFPFPVVPLVQRLTGGVPRRINLLCDRALLGAYVENSPVVTKAILRRAAQEVFPGQAPAARRLWPFALAGGLSVALLAAAAVWNAAPGERGQGAATQIAAHKPSGRAAAGAAGSVGPERAGAGTGDASALGGIGRGPDAASAARADRNATMAVDAHAGLASSAGSGAAATAPMLAALGQPDRGAAVRVLGTLWNAALEGDDPCQAALRQNLRCYQGKGGLYELRLLDRPAVVTLHDGARTTYAIVTAMTGRTATVLADGRRAQVDVGVLATRMDGEFTTLWRMARGFRDELRAGDSGADVDWLAGELAALNHAAAPITGTPLDAHTQDLLRRFQHQQNLKADGLAGPRTFMRVNQLRAVPEPRLLVAQNGK